MTMRGVELHSIADLQQNLQMDELLSSFQSGELEIWLRKIGKAEHSAQLHEIPENAYVLVQLYQLFGWNPTWTEEEIRGLSFF